MNTRKLWSMNKIVYSYGKRYCDPLPNISHCRNRALTSRRHQANPLHLELLQDLYELRETSVAPFCALPAWGHRGENPLGEPRRRSPAAASCFGVVLSSMSPVVITPRSPPCSKPSTIEFRAPEASVQPAPASPAMAPRWRVRAPSPPPESTTVVDRVAYRLDHGKWFDIIEET
jgi:hypothetical protein